MIFRNQMTLREFIFENELELEIETYNEKTELELEAYSEKIEYFRPDKMKFLYKKIMYDTIWKINVDLYVFGEDFGVFVV